MVTKTNEEVIEKRIKLFWEQQEKFRSHPLQTELPNTETHKLSELAKNDLAQAIRLIQGVDVKAIAMMKDYSIQLDELRNRIKSTFENGHRMFICGCGASGRLAVFIEFLWRRTVSEKNRDKVIGFLAGGDNAMIKSLEGFEDHGSYGVKQLLEAGFEDGDLLISATASGESPFILAATEYAANTSVKPWFLHCNTNEALKGRIKNHVIYNPNVISMSLYVGQMALTGSTRMQATTALMLGIGLPLFSEESITKELDFLEKFVADSDLSSLQNIIAAEADTYRNNEYVLYDTFYDYGVTVLTDTTERAPTFNLAPFENQLDDNKKASWCYLLFSDADEVKDAWELLLARKPRTLNWDYDTSLERLMGFDFSKKIIDYRNDYAVPSHSFSIKKEDNCIVISFKGHIAKFNIEGLNPLFEQIYLKLILNTASTLMLGRLGYYEGNLMTSLYPSNSKLIDRAIRYIDFLVTQKTGKKLEYEYIAENMFAVLKALKPNESIVIKTVEKLVNS